MSHRIHRKGIRTCSILIVLKLRTYWVLWPLIHSSIFLRLFRHPHCEHTSRRVIVSDLILIRQINYTCITQKLLVYYYTSCCTKSPYENAASWLKYVSSPIWYTNQWFAFHSHWNPVFKVENWIPMCLIQTLFQSLFFHVTWIPPIPRTPAATSSRILQEAWYYPKGSLKNA